MEKSEIDEMTKSVEAMSEFFDKKEEMAERDIIKYFDRMHDKLFAYHLFFLAGYISLVAIPSINISIWWLVIPIFCVWRLIYIDWKMMEQNRSIANIKTLNKEQIDKLTKKQ